jgi:hypothetical protein
VSAGRLPTFLIIGAQKSATTTVWAWLRAHPQVYCPPNKELAWFATDESWRQGTDAYAAAFAEAGDALIVGEASPQYTMFPRYHGVAERVAATLPDARLVYVVRDPVERMRSAYRHALAGGSETRPIDEALITDARYHYPSCYALQLEQYLRVVDRERILVVASESLRPDPRPTIGRVLAFLGASPDAGVEPAADRNLGADKRAPRPYWRAVGGALIRHDLAHRTPEVIRRMARERHPLLTREIRPEEIALSDSVRQRLVEVLRPEMARFRNLAGDDVSDADVGTWAPGPTRAP